MARIVLCVDDDPDDRELIRNAIFKVDPSYTVAQLDVIPIVVFSTSNHPSDQNFCRLYGVEFVTKPANFKQITAEAARLLQHCAE